MDDLECVNALGINVRPQYDLNVVDDVPFRTELLTGRPLLVDLADRDSQLLCMQHLRFLAKSNHGKNIIPFVAS